MSCMCSLDSMATCYVPDEKRIDDSVPVGFERHSPGSILLQQSCLL